MSTEVKHIMNILTGLSTAEKFAGHDTLEWDANNEIEIANMKKKFKEMLDKGYSAFKIDPKTKKSIPMKEFDPIAEEILLTPPARKG